MNNESGEGQSHMAPKENPPEKIKINSIFNPISEREQLELRIQSNITNLQNSTINNFKSGIRTEPANFFL